MGRTAIAVCGLLSLYHIHLATALPSTLYPRTSSARYDYVVVGGGNAGLAVASRLTEDPSVTVVVLEAGPNAEDLPDVFIPGFAGAGKSFASLNWAYKTVPQENFGGRAVGVAAGKALGGGTVINSMIHPRAEKEQYDGWGVLNDDPQWTWEALLPYFKKSESFVSPDEYQVQNDVRDLEEVHGTSSEGRVKVGFPNYFYPQSHLWASAIDFEPSPDLADGKPQGTVGVSPNALDAHNNTRCSAACGYYTPFKDRPNLTVLTEVLATKIVWDPPAANTTLRAVAVQFQAKDGHMWQVFVRKEVVLSAGAIGSPKILELSGVGNATILERAGVKTVLDLPTVGENFIDHVHSWANAFTTAELTRDSLKLDPDLDEEQQQLWYLNRTGMYSAAPRTLSLALPSQLFKDDVELNDLLEKTRKDAKYYAELFSNGNENLARGIEWQYEFALKGLEEDNSAPVEINFEPGYAGPTKNFSDRPARKFSAINAVLVNPWSRGRTHISSSDAKDMPTIDPAYYAHPLDLITHVKSIQLGREMLRMPPLDTIYDGEFEPGDDVKTEDALTEWAVDTSGSDNHIMGSLAMMPEEYGGVVDSRLRVYGVENVRVVDASIIPFPISAHLSATVYMIAERGSDFIKEDARMGRA
ncbi:hypothetical protein CVT26_013674 [Gymnopilus dilepis]|uniref:pyranose dehydrogenase (acceptor) n=1 Tax=Gymnopilus dilepis TaxID=231916 RepID=A0A409YWB0_9AGAR|nr:hypothetical protein CVT26_013674 [Gymnopilus dilepis]